MMFPIAKKSPLVLGGFNILNECVSGMELALTLVKFFSYAIVSTPSSMVASSSTPTPLTIITESVPDV